jgi:uncharacterized protein with ATP-grasp and redox domains
MVLSLVHYQVEKSFNGVVHCKTLEPLDMENYKRKYRDLEMRVLRELRNKVENSKHISKHLSEKSIIVNVFDYTELTLVNDRLTFLDKNGLHHSLFADCNLEDLINLLNAPSD